MGYRIQNRRDTAARWAEMNPILLEGEMGIVLDDPNQYKIGDGVHTWNELPLRGFTGTIAQTLGNNENAVASQKVVTEKFAEQDEKLSDIGSEVEKEASRAKEEERLLDVRGKNNSNRIDSNEENINEILIRIKRINDKEFCIADTNGNIIAKFDKDGLAVTSLDADKVSAKAIRTSQIIDEYGNQIGDNYLSDIIKVFNESELAVTDSHGNIVLKISANGIETTKIVTKESGGIGQVYGDYELFTVGDSFAAGNVWNSYLASLLGCKFNEEANIKGGMNISTGGTTTSGGALDSAFFRVKNLHDQGLITNEGEKAIILLENVNDVGTGVYGSMEDVPLIPKTPIEVNSTIFDAALLDSIPSEKRELNACIAFYNIAKGKRLTITKLPTKEGDVEIMTGWSGPGKQYYSIHVVPQKTEEETMAYILDRILENNYTGVTDIDGGDGKSVIFSCGRYVEGGSYKTFLSFTDTDNTGMECSISSSSIDDVEARVKTTRFFISDSINDWNDVNSWVDGSCLNMYRAWKSCIEYLLSTYPKAKVVLTAFPLYRFDHNLYVRANGTKDYESFNASDIMKKNNDFCDFIKELSLYYKIPYIDVTNNCGITLDNISSYYPNNNAHPTNDGYYRMSGYIANQIKSIINNNI